MAVDDRFRAQFADLERQRREMREGAPDLPQGGGGAKGGGMEERITRLERSIDQVSKDVVDLRVTTATLVERVAHLPGKGFVVTAATSTVAALTAVLLLLKTLGILH